MQSNSQNNKHQYLQIPSRDFNVFASHNQSIHQSLHQLSNVQDKSFFSSEPEDPDPAEIQDFLFRIDKIKKDESQKSSQIHKSNRLEDQQIIVVEQQNELQSQNDKQSVILQHIQFDTDAHAIDQYQQSNQKKIEQIDYPRINYLNVKQPPWLDKQSESIQEDLQSIDYKINHNRQSKNTCVDPKRSLLSIPNKLTKSHKTSYNKNVQYQHQLIGQTNKNKLLVPYPNHNKMDKRDHLNNIIDKWANENFTDSNTSGKAKQISKNFKIRQYNSLEHPQFRYNKNSQQFSDDLDEQNIFSNKKLKQPETKRPTIMDLPVSKEQRNYQYLQGQRNYQYLQECYEQNKIQMQQYKSRIEQLILQNEKQKEKNSTDKKEIIKTKEIVLTKEAQISKLQSIQKQTIKILTQLEKKKVEEEHKFIKRIQELDKKIQYQNTIIKEYEAKNAELHQKLIKVTNQSEKKLQMAKSKKMDKEQEENMHRKCKQQIQHLQEYIFDIEQQLAGIDLEVQRRTKGVINEIQKNLGERINQQYQKIVDDLKEECEALKQMVSRIERQRQLQVQNWNAKNNQLYKKQIEINYRDAQIQNKQRELVRYQNELKNKSVKLNSIYDSFTDKKPIENQKIKENYYSPKTDTKSNLNLINSQKRQYNNNNNRIYQTFARPRQSFESNYSKPYVSQKEIGQDINKSRKSIHKYNKDFYRSPKYSTNQLSFNKLRENQNESHNLSMPCYDEKLMRKQIFKRQSQNNELMSINSKIQKLRKQINKQLESIH